MNVALILTSIYADYETISAGLMHDVLEDCDCTPEEMEEELRLMYVATTRAKNNLYISYPVDMYDYSMGMVLSRPSRFLDNISDDKLEVWDITEC